MTEHVLIKSCVDWADEMDVSGFAIITRKHWEYIKLEARHTDFSDCEFYVGSNQHVEFDDADDYINSFEVHDITPEEVKIFKKFFNGYDQGKIIWAEGNAPDDFYKEYGYCPD